MSKSIIPVAGRRRIVQASVAAVAAPAIIGSARAQGRVTWKVQSHWPKASGSYKDSLIVLQKELEERTDGRFKLQLFGAGELAKGPEIFNFVRRGVVEMGTGSPAYFLDEAQTATFTMGIPGTLRESWEMQHYLKNLGVEEMVNVELAAQGVMLRSEKVYPTELVVRKPIETMEQFQSLKLRSAGTLLEYFNSAGASPTFVAGSELYQALSSGVVDGAHWGAAIGALSMSLWEVAPFHVRPSVMMATDVFLMNKAAVDKLPDDLRFQFLSLMEERFWRRSAEYQHKEEIALAKGRNEMKVQVISFPEAVQQKMAVASKAILEKEKGRGEKAGKAAEILTGLMKDLGYA